MKKTISLVLAMVLTILLSTADLTAQSRISFKRGSSSATVSGTIGVNRGAGGGANYRSYVVRAKSGQTISATVSARNGKVVFVDNDETSLTIDTDESKDYVIRVYNGGEKSTGYTITISIR